jgi:hypothetical protein
LQNNKKGPEVAQLYPPEFRDALVSAGGRGDHAMIDALTDQLATRGYCRHRHADETPAPANRWELGA